MLIVSTILLVLPPVMFLILASLGLGPVGSQAGLTLSNYFSVLEDPFFISSLINTIAIAAFASLIATGLGFVLAFISMVIDVPLATRLNSVMTGMLALPAFIESMGWTFLLSPRSGLINVTYSRLIGSEQPLFNIYSFTGLVLAMGLNLTPVSYFLISPAFSLVDRTLVDMSRVYGGGLLRTVYRIYLPILLPSVISSYLYTFIISIEAFDTPAIIGIPSGIYVLTTSIYKKMVSDVPPDYGGATAYAVFLTGLASLAVWSYRYIITRAERFRALSGRSELFTKLKLGKRMKYCIMFFVLIYLIIHPFSVIGVLILAAIHPFWNPDILLQKVTLENFILFVSYPISGAAVINSLFIAVITTIFTIIMGFAISYFCYRRPFKGSNTLAVVASLPLAIPPIVLAIGVFWTTLFLNIGIYGTLWALIYAYSLRYIPLVVRLISGPLLQIGNEIEEAARLYGGFFRGLVYIIIPLMKVPLIFAATYVTIIVLTNLSIAVLLVTRDSIVLSTVIYALWNTGERLPAAAGGLMYFAAILSLSLIGGRFLSKRIS
jgi:iron(III) transport system permease protein